MNVSSRSTSSKGNAPSSKSTVAGLSFQSIQAYEQSWKHRSMQVFNTYIDKLILDHQKQLKSLKASNRDLNRRLDESELNVKEMARRIEKLERENVRLIQRSGEMSITESIQANFIPIDISRISIKAENEQERTIVELKNQIIGLHRRIRDLEEINIINNRQLQDMSISKYLSALIKKLSTEDKLFRPEPKNPPTSFSCLLETKKSTYQLYNRVSIEYINKLIMNPAEVKHVILSNQSKY